MKIHGPNRCLVAATVWFLIAHSSGIAAQEQVPSDEEEAQKQESLRRLFVSDKLVLNVYAEPGQGSERVASIETGDAVQEIERAANFVHVRLEDGREGWVGASYLTSDAPAAAQVRELEREKKAAVQAAEKKSADEITRLKKEAAALQAQLSELKSTSAPAATARTDDAASLTDEARNGSERNEESKPAASVPAGAVRISWWWPLIAVLAIGLGYVAGYQTLARRIRRKFGGLKIY